MKRKDIIELLRDIKPYDKGTHMMWTDPYIAKHLLEAHLDPTIDAASRNKTNVRRTLDWIDDQIVKKKCDLLDLGCGPGLYTTDLSKRGYNVSGYDFSMNSINYAKNVAKHEGLNIKYECMDYLTMTNENEFDMIMMIYCDFGVLSSDERNQLIENIYKALRPGGVFIFDSLNSKFADNLKANKSWDISEGGFWQEKPYTCLTEWLHFEEIRGVLEQHIVIDEVDDYKLYRFWNHYFNLEDVKSMFEAHNFSNIEKYEGLLEDDDSVTFYKIKK